MLDFETLREEGNVSRLSVQCGVNTTLYSLELIKLSQPSVFLHSGGHMLFRRLREMLREKLKVEEVIDTY